MFYKISKNSTTNSPVQEINCTINIYLDEDTECKNAVDWLPFTIDTDLLLGVPEEKINDTINKLVQEKAYELCNSESFQRRLEKIKINQSIKTPEMLDPID